MFNDKNNNLFSIFTTFLFLVLSIFLVFNPSETMAQSAAALESPTLGSYESGVGLIRGWVCDAGRVEVSIDGGPLLYTAYGTKRGDTATACGDDNNGFGLTFNWNNIGDGVHNLRALADGVEFANVNFVVITLGADYLTNLSREFDLSNFPTTGDTVTLRWAEPYQNFVFQKTIEVPKVTNPPVLADAQLESPTQGSYESGVGLIRGWVCDAGRVEVSIDGGPLLYTAYGTKRGDTATACGDDNNGFGLTFNWNNIGDGVHNLRALADGVEFANVNFAVTTLGVDYLTGASGQYDVPGFPQSGETTKLRWSEPHQNFIIARSTAAGDKIGSVAAIADLLNSIAIAGVSINQADSVGVQVKKDTNGKPLSLTSLDWTSLKDDSSWTRLLLNADGFPSRYEDSSGAKVDFDFTDQGVSATFFDGRGTQIAGLSNFPLDVNRLIPLINLVDRLKNPAQSAAATYADNPKAIHMAAAAKSPFSLDAQLLDMIWASGVASKEMLCAVQAGATQAGLGTLILDAAQGCSSTLLQGFGALADASGGTDPAVQKALNFVEDVTDAPCDANASGNQCLTSASQALKAKEDPAFSFPLHFTGTKSYTDVITPEWGARTPCEPAKIDVPFSITLFADGSARIVSSGYYFSFDYDTNGVCKSVSMTMGDLGESNLRDVHANGKIAWDEYYTNSDGTDRLIKVSGSYDSTSFTMQAKSIEQHTLADGHTYSLVATITMNATAQQDNTSTMNIK